MTKPLKPQASDNRGQSPELSKLEQLELKLKKTDPHDVTLADIAEFFGAVITDKNIASSQDIMNARRIEKTNAKSAMMAMRWLFGRVENCRSETPHDVFFYTLLFGGAGAAYLFKRYYPLILTCIEATVIALLATAFHYIQGYVILTSLVLFFAAMRAAIAYIAAFYFWSSHRQKLFAKFFGRHAEADKLIRRFTQDENGNQVPLN